MSTSSINTTLASLDIQGLSTIVEGGLISTDCECASDLDFCGQINYSGEEKVFIANTPSQIASISIFYHIGVPQLLIIFLYKCPCPK